MKKFIVLIIISLLCSSCFNNEEKEFTDYKIVKINNHEYIVLHIPGVGDHGICHYEDCAYCSKIVKHEKGDIDYNDVISKY